MEKNKKNMITSVAMIVIISLVILIIMGPMRVIFKNISDSITSGTETSATDRENLSDENRIARQCISVYKNKQDAINGGPNLIVRPNRPFDFQTPLSTMIIVDKGGKFLGKIGDNIPIVPDFKSNHSEFYIYHENYISSKEENLCIVYR